MLCMWAELRAELAASRARQQQQAQTIAALELRLRVADEALAAEQQRNAKLVAEFAAPQVSV